MALLIERAQAQKAQALASEIRNQTVLEEAGDDVATLKAMAANKAELVRSRGEANFHGEK